MATSYRDGHISNDSPGPSAAAPCHECRARKVKCDRRTPRCGPCHRLSFGCSFSGRGELSESSKSKLEQSELTQAGTRRKRIRNACEACRVVKAKCSGGNPCSRCDARGHRCVHRPPTAVTTNEMNTGMEHLQTEASPGLPTPATAGSGVGVEALPGDRAVVRQYIEDYFDNTRSGSCIFLHKPSVLSAWNGGTLDPNLLKTVCAAGFHFRASSEASERARAWMGESQSSILANLDRISITQLQTLMLIVRFRLDTGQAVEAWNLLSLAARLAFTLRLNHEAPELDAVARETRRRLLWAVYIMDRIFSGGLDELSVCPTEQVHIRLPCDDRSFERGIQSRAEYLQDDRQDGDMDVLAYMIRLYDSRHRILRLTKQIRREGSSPIASADQLASLQAELDNFGETLPEHLRLTPERISLVAHSKDAHGYVMLHTVKFQNYYDIYRLLTPGLREAVSQEIIEGTPKEYKEFCHKMCLTNVIQMCEFWANVYRHCPSVPSEDWLFGTSLYQATQFLHHVHHLLPPDGPNSLHSLRGILEKAVSMASTPRSDGLRIGECLRAAEALIAVLGQVDHTTRRSSPGNIHHLPSQGSFIPRPSNADDVPSGGIEGDGAESGASESLQKREVEPQGIFGHFTSDLDVPTELGLAFDDQMGLVPWDPFKTAFSGYYETELEALAMPMN